MANTIRTVLYLDDDASEMLAQMSSGVNQRGRFVSELLRREFENRQAPSAAASYEELGREIERLVQARSKQQDA